jgi:hypothetical protein
MLGVFHAAILASVSATLRTIPTMVLDGLLDRFCRKAYCSQKSVGSSKAGFLFPLLWTYSNSSRHTCNDVGRHFVKSTVAGCVKLGK